ncbi:cation diffusion facilitator family transporter [Phocaeicola acetigenes]|jgi:cation diffusion facilitator family transporter|uniref:Cation diffusion facilitator family transporter n=1 Tax=Phocaeicola acetigenes TaxID=3016083 RepID=A0ABT4PFF7_9BACT|nr:cation diffusion facilitator family transporter [Phocaeicola sp. KGMB11183]MCZ8371741.1 cation diffusion facilitator family transporter [Phocaeicola sp. KGMB11183]
MEIHTDQIKLKVQKRIVLVSFVILIAKFIAYYVTHSVGVLTDALESIVNVVAGAVSLYSLHLAMQPQDRNHPFGHGKIELISASSEGILIIIAGIMIIYEAVKRLLFPVEIQKLDIGIYIIAFSGIINYLLGTYSIRTGKKHNSVALVAGGKHLHSDTYSTIGLVIGLLALFFTKISWIDSALALLFGGIIIFTGISILRQTITGLVDHADEQLLGEMVTVLNENRQPEWIDIHNTKIIKSGNYLYIDCDLTVPWYYTVEAGHNLGSQLKDVLNQKYGNRIQLTIHIDPCNITQTCKCEKCMLVKCPHRQKPFTQQQNMDILSFTNTELEKS